MSARWRATALLALICGFAAAVASAAGNPQESLATGKTAGGKGKSQSESSAQLEHTFFGLIRESDASKFLTYVPAGGVNVGSKAEHLGRAEVEEQLTQHTGLYCKLFDSSCLTSEIRLGQSNVRTCSY